MSEGYKVAVVGASGLVGSELLRVLEERSFPVSELVALASSRSAGETVQFAGSNHVIQDAASPGAFDGVQIALMSAGGAASRELAPIAAQAGAVVIDNSSAWREDPEVPLVVPEVNPDAIAKGLPKGIIANPNCSTIQMVVALAPLHRSAGLKRVVVSTYQAASGAGKAAMDELGLQVQAVFSSREPEVDRFPKRLAFNCIPHIDTLHDDGWSREERKMIRETRKIMGLPELGVMPTCVRVPVFNGHAESVLAEFEEPLSVEKARLLLDEAAGVTLMDDAAKASYPTQLEAEGQDETLVGRLRHDPSSENGLAFWCVADNLRKGAATNAVQIAELVAPSLELH
ncbi:MAG: aspartate-semialdehyde dehydrogenase [Myxococcota bacterium]